MSDTYPAPLRPAVPAHSGSPVGGPNGHAPVAPAAPRPLTPAAPAGPPRITPPPSLARPKDDLSSVSMIEEAPHATINKITAFGVKDMDKEREFKRAANMTGTGAVHVKTFHGHLSDDGVRRLDDKINDWLEAHPTAEVKFATTTIGVWDGKTKDQAMIINVWY
jgi:hypothetical protein